MSKSGVISPSSKAIRIRTTGVVTIPGEMRTFPNGDGTYYTAIWAFNAIGAALIVGQPYVLRRVGTAATTQNPQLQGIGAAAAVPGVPQFIVVGINATPNNAWDWVAIDGCVTARVAGSISAITAGDTLAIVNATSTTRFVRDGLGSALTVNTHAISKETTSLSVSVRICLRGIPAVVQ